jgi:hypothetical protein
MSDKIARLGIQRDNDLMYYIKNGDVWATPRKQKGRPKGKAMKVATTGIELDYSKYIYFLDGDGDVARKARALGGGGRKAKPSKAAAPSKPSKASKSSAAPSAAPSAVSSAPRTGKKSKAQLEREIQECLARSPGGNGNGNGNGAKTNGNGKPAVKTKAKKKKRG